MDLLLAMPVAAGDDDEAGTAPVTLTNGQLLEQRAMSEARARSLAPGLTALRKAREPSVGGIVICNVRDERPILPHFLAHYRASGVRRFAFIDNGSEDGSGDFLLAQPDCDVYRFTGSYRDAGSGTVWKNVLLSEYRDAPWILSVDADEHAVYDGWPEVDLPCFAETMSRDGHAVATALMVDMYGPGPVADTTVAPEGTLLDACPLFDGEGYAVTMPEDWRRDTFPRLNIVGGPVMRIFGTTRAGWLAKAPLVLEPNIIFLDPHTVHPATLNFAAPRIALLHFRMLASLAEKAARVSERATHSRGSLIRYQQLGEKLAAEPGFSFAYAGSVRFEMPRQFVKRGMIRPLGRHGLP